MSKEKESRYAEALQKLGFAKIPLDISENIRKTLPRNKRRFIKSGTLKPTFSASEIITYVTDEFGQSWCAAGNRSVDLKQFPFIDHSEEVISEIKEMRRHDRRYN